MNPKYYLILILLAALISVENSAQDMIERAQLGIAPDVTRAVSSVAYEESQSLKLAGPYQVVEPFILANSASRSVADEYVEGHIMLEMPSGMLPRLMVSMAEGIDLRIPVAMGREIELELVEVFPISSEFTGRTSDGQIYSLSDYPARFYRGAIKNVPNSFASISVANGMFQGLIGDDYGNYVLAGLDGGTSDFVLYNDKKLKIRQEFVCGTEDIPYPEEDQELLRKTERIVNTSRSDNCIDIMVEMEEDFYDDWNNVTDATNFIYALLNEVATLYNNENISITLKDIIMWTATDPYDEDDSCDQRSQFAAYRQNNYNGRLAHLISSRSTGGGCAFIDKLCSVYIPGFGTGPFCWSGGMGTAVTAFPTYSWNVMVFTHEMGHVIGSRHTHACVWNGNDTAIDGCSGETEGSCDLPGIPAGGGTIMSYCHQASVGINFNLGFGTQPGNKIRDEVYNSPCTLDCGSSVNCPRYIYLDGEVDEDTYYANIKIEMGGEVLSFKTINLRSGGLIELNPGLKVWPEGYLSMDYSTCTPALTATSNTKVQETIDPDNSDQKPSSKKSLKNQ